MKDSKPMPGLLAAIAGEGQEARAEETHKVAIEAAKRRNSMVAALYGIALLAVLATAPAIVIWAWGVLL